ncbi:MAG: chemotaxis protein CheW [Clostridia bacterium]|nr:chemotaxis protein CheW [Clostridia bacterium]
MTGKVLTFRLEGGLLGIDITLVKEISRSVEFTPVPDAPEYIVGLFNMRGQVVTLLNLMKMIGKDGKKWEQKSACIFLKNLQGDASDQVGFPIDAPGDVVDIEDEQCEPPPANVGGMEGEFIECVVKLEDELLIIIDPLKVFEQ